MARRFGHRVRGLRFTRRLGAVAVNFFAPDRLRPVTCGWVARHAMCTVGLSFASVDVAPTVTCGFVSANVTRGLISADATRPVATAIVSSTRASPVAAAVITA